MNDIYPDSLLIYCDIIFSCCVGPGWVLPMVLSLTGRVWVWDKIYTHVRVRVRIVDKILGHGCGFG
jgi:hypothetical protein